MRKSTIKRKTKETDIDLGLYLDGSGKHRIDTTIPFFNHMLESFSKHSCIDLNIKASGDTDIDDHHLVEDIGLVLGKSVYDALGDKKGIFRYGNFLMPMDEALSYVVIDCGGRPFFQYNVPFVPQSKAPFSFELFEDFFQAFAMEAKINLHIKLFQGRNNHHIAESLFKGFAKSLRQAVSYDKIQDVVPSTKGIIE